MEDFVPYKLAKKLNEKGFTLPKSNIIGKFDSDGVFHSQLYINFTETMDSEEIIAPTISQVLKWLREVKKIFICIDLLESGYCYDIQKNVVINNAEFDFDVVMLMAGRYETYELAALAGIEYILDNNFI